MHVLTRGGKLNVLNEIKCFYGNVKSLNNGFYFVSPHTQTYVPTVFENYTAGLELEEQRVELSLWDTSGERETDQQLYSGDKACFT